MAKKWGGARRNSGPKPKPKKVVLAKDVAEDVYAGIDPVAYWRAFLHADEDLSNLNALGREEARTTFRELNDRVFGKSVAKTEVSGGDKPIGVVAAHVDLSQCSDADLIRAEELVRTLTGKVTQP